MVVALKRFFEFISNIESSVTSIPGIDTRPKARLIELTIFELAIAFLSERVNQIIKDSEPTRTIIVIP
jgi:hypothetical protein